jgi:hypothetical protein
MAGLRVEGKNKRIGDPSGPIEHKQEPMRAPIYISNIVARKPISSIEGRRRSFFSFLWPDSTIEKDAGRSCLAGGPPSDRRHPRGPKDRDRLNLLIFYGPRPVIAAYPGTTWDASCVGCAPSGFIDSPRISVTLRGSLVGFVQPQRADVRPQSESPF